MRTRFAILAACALCMAAAWADAPIYKWVDAQGKVHYGPQPQGDAAQQLSAVNKGQGIPAGGTVAPAATAAPSDGTALTQAGPNDSAACKAAKDTLAKYLGADYLYTLDASGQKQKMSKEDQDKTIASAKDSVAKACSGGGTP
jgi:hypothetical protein